MFCCVVLTVLNILFGRFVVVFCYFFEEVLFSVPAVADEFDPCVECSHGWFVEDVEFFCGA